MGGDVATAMKHQARAEHCERLGGSLLEVRTADDAQELAEIVWRLTKDYLRSTSWIATGGVGWSPDGDLGDPEWAWAGSLAPVDYGPASRVLKSPETESAWEYPAEGAYLYLVAENFNSLADGRFGAVPFYDLYTRVSADVEKEFMCVKDGWGAADLAPSLHVLPFSAAERTVKQARD